MRSALEFAFELDGWRDRERVRAGRTDELESDKATATMALMAARRAGGETRATESTGAPPPDESRRATMRRVKRMTLEERIDLFERLARDAAWASGTRRVR